MTEVRPWEPVSYRWEISRLGPSSRSWPWGYEDVCEGIDSVWSAHITLANSQRIIVRALSEERKAARAMQKRVNKAVEANR